MGGHFYEVRACAMWIIANGDTVGVVLLEDDVDYQTESMM